MMHSRGIEEEEEEVVDICTPQELGTFTMQPCLYHYKREHAEFWPVEFDEMLIPGRHDAPSHVFLSELSLALVRFELEDVLGLSYAPSLPGPLTEYLLPNTRGTIARRSPIESKAGSRIVTAWIFSVVDGTCVFSPEMECNQTPSGVHDPPPKTRSQGHLV